MFSSRLWAAALAAAVMAVLCAPSASAATEFGDNCVANDSSESALPLTVFALSAPENPLSLTAPEEGVITRWMVNVFPDPVSIPVTLRVLRQTGPKTVLVVGESAQVVKGGPNGFETRIPVRPGDRLGLSGVGEHAILACKLSSLEGRFASLANGGGVGSIEEIGLESQGKFRFPVAAIVEPDADHDGYGDETQDRCPQNAATHEACPAPPAPPSVVPPLTLGASTRAKGSTVKVVVTTSAQASVSVVGSVKLGKRRSARLDGGTKTVAAGTLAEFVLSFPKALKARLAALSPKRSLPLHVTVTAPNAAGAITSSELTVKLKGRAKPERRQP